MTTPGFPNLFMIYGPNTNIVVNGPIIFFSECSVRYILGLPEAVGRDRAPVAMEPRREVHDAFNIKVDEGNRLMGLGLRPQVTSWYKNENGRVSQNWPFALVDYWRATLRRIRRTSCSRKRRRTGGLKEQTMSDLEGGCACGASATRSPSRRCRGRRLPLSAVPVQFRRRAESMSPCAAQRLRAHQGLSQGLSGSPGGRRQDVSRVFCAECGTPLYSDPEKRAFPGGEDGAGWTIPR